jgi:hypothetical protein
LASIVERSRPDCQNLCAALFVSTLSPARSLCAGCRPPARNADPHPYMDRPLVTLRSPLPKKCRGEICPTFRRVMGQEAPIRFRTIQICPKDLPPGLQPIHLKWAVVRRADKCRLLKITGRWLIGLQLVIACSAPSIAHALLAPGLEYMTLAARLGQPAEMHQKSAGFGHFRKAATASNWSSPFNSIRSNACCPRPSPEEPGPHVWDPAEGPLLSLLL